MAIENSLVIDAVGTEVATNVVVLTILDGWDWSDEDGHLLALQGKLNGYFEFIESGQLVENYPLSAGKPVRIDIVARHPLTTRAADLVSAAAQVAHRGLGIEIDHKVAEG